MLTDQDRLLLRSIVFVGIVTIITAWFSDLFYFPDEHYQVLEFMSQKLAITPASDLPWEYAARIRPWMQPFLYFLIAKAVIVLGVRDLFNVTFILRLITGLFSLAALAIFARQILSTIEGQAEKRVFLGYLPFFGFLPYLFVRTSSETLSGDFFAMGLSLALAAKPKPPLFWAGLLCGLAFECRYQTAILSAGLLAWLVIIARIKWGGTVHFMAGGIGALCLGLLADRWGYGSWEFPPWSYFQTNIIQGVASGTFGSDPVFAYLYLIPAQIFFAITLVLMAAMIMMWLRNPRHVLTWVTLPFALVHMMIAHKEARFFFPLAILATSFPVLAFSPALPKWRGLMERVWQWRLGNAAKLVTAISVIAMSFFAVYPFGLRPHMPMAKYLYRHFSGVLYSFVPPTGVYSYDPPFQSYPMYRTARLRSRKLESVQQLHMLLDKGAVYLLCDTPSLPQGVPQNVHAQLLFSEFPFAIYGYGALGTRFAGDYNRFVIAAPWLKLLPLDWLTLYRLERSTAMRS